MIIEGAFLKLPEILLGHWSPETQYEATLTNYIAMGVLLELSARNIGLPMEHIHIEKSYPKINKSKSTKRLDLYVDLEGIYNNVSNHNLYGMKDKNWIEAKFFGGMGRQAGTQKKTENVAIIALDLFRLCLFIKESRSKFRDNARYLLLVFNRQPKNYLAFRRKNSSYPKREWLNLLLKPGINEVDIILEREPKTFRKIFGKGFDKHHKNFSLKIRVETRTFFPIKLSSEYLYWGYLIRIIGFEIFFGDDNLIYEDIGEKKWTKEQEEIQKHLIKKFIEMH